jgi:hypothetical protein
MKHCVLFLLFLFPACLLAGDSTMVVSSQKKKLKGYRNLFYKFVSKHPRLNSPLERALLQHYLLGSGETFHVSASDFKRLQQTVPVHIGNAVCQPVKTNHTEYCLRYVNLHDDDYFGWGVGNLTVIYNANRDEIVSFVDYYDFDKKKKGKRTIKNEFFTRLFRIAAPASARSFVVTYNADVVYLHP